MATAYAALVSLMNVLIRYQHPTCPVSFNQSQIQSMLNRVSSLVDFLESNSQRMSADLLGKMAAASFAAEDTIESYYMDQLLATSTGISTTVYDLLCRDLEKATKGMDLIIQEAMLEMKEQTTSEKDQQPESSVPAGPGAHSSEMVKMVGLDEELLRLMDQLTSHNKSTLQILPIVGMVGIGKTTLARNLFEHPYVKNYFHIQAWVTISHDYTVDNVIHSLLKDLKVVGTGGEQLYKHLCGRKYLIVLDDIWDGFVWNEIRRFFPGNSNGSRILITTRISNVAVSVGSCSAHKVELLDDKKSWDLLSETVFGQQDCPHDLLKCGEEIAKSCKGLPLTITVVGGLLKAEKTLIYWENVATDLKSLISTEGDGHCMKIVSLSYHHLPIHLKPCFLYMATFREDERVLVDDLTSLWVADGFLKSQNDRTLEEVALEHLNHLIDRNLVMVADRGHTGQVTWCSLHDLLREFCLREARKEKFVYHVNKDVVEAAEILESGRRLVWHLQAETEITHFPSVSVARSLICLSNGVRNVDISSHIPNLRLLRVLSTSDEVDYNVDIRHLVNLRYLKLNVPRFFSSIPLFWNLETLHTSISEVSISQRILPSELWECPNLRHVSTVRDHLVLADPTNAQSCCVLKNLQSLTGIKNWNVSDDVVMKIPDLKRLNIGYESEFVTENLEKIQCYFTNIARLHKLKVLVCEFGMNLEDDRCVFNEPKKLTFSSNLRQLYLLGSYIPWEYIGIVGSLPKLEALGIYDDAFWGEEWSPTEGDFQCLKYLCINNCNLRIWRAESFHFPMLEHLVLWRNMELEEVPFGIGHVASLQSIILCTTEMSVVISAKEISDERQNLQGEDDDFVIKGKYYGAWDERSILDDMASSNFRVKFY